jgi:hypothetical protein
MLSTLILLEKKILTSKDNYFMNNILLLRNYNRELKDLPNSLSVVDLLIGKKVYLASRKFV